MCARCERPVTQCVCGLVAPVQGEAELLILQHPMEAGHDKGSGRLLQLCVQGSRLLRGEQFDHGQLDELLHGGGRLPVLLFPHPGETPAPPVLPAARHARLVVLDGTWRKCRKMLHLNPALAALPRMALVEPPPSRYAIRTAHAVDQLSTLEATCLALATLERAPDRYQPVLHAFDRFVASHPALAHRAR